MRKRQFTPWPAYVDLFSVLLFFTLGAFVKTHTELENLDSDTLLQELATCRDELAKCQEGLFDCGEGYEECQGQLEDFEPLLEAQKRARSVYEMIQELEISGVSYDRCSVEDVCIDVSLEFDTDQDLIRTAGERRTVDQVCRGIRQTLDALARDDTDFHPRDLQIVVEGHADQRSVQATDPRLRFKGNWDLSARRASSVLYALRACGVSSENGYNVVSWGLADTDPLCREPTEACYQQNRRTTIRLRFDYKAYERRISAGGG